MDYARQMADSVKDITLDVCEDLRKQVPDTHLDIIIAAHGAGIIRLMEMVDNFSTPDRFFSEFSPENNPGEDEEILAARLRLFTAECRRKGFYGVRLEVRYTDAKEWRMLAAESGFVGSSFHGSPSAKDFALKGTEWILKNADVNELRSIEVKRHEDTMRAIEHITQAKKFHARISVGGFI